MASKIIKQYFYRLFRPEAPKLSPCDLNCKKMYKSGVSPDHFNPPHCPSCGIGYKFELTKSEEAEITVSNELDRDE